MISLRRLLWALPAAFFAAACAFFIYYTLRLVYVFLFVADFSVHRPSGIFVGAVAFPVAAVMFGYMSIRCLRAARSR